MSSQKRMKIKLIRYPFKQHFKSTIPRMDLRKYITFKLVNHFNPIGAMKSFTKNNCNLFMEEHLTILKKLCDKRITIMNKHSKLYGACWHQPTFGRFCLSTDGPVIMLKCQTVQRLLNIRV